jgi:O-antigen/teichoic acid export membrane protein
VSGVWTDRFTLRDLRSPEPTATDDAAAIGHSSARPNQRLVNPSGSDVVTPSGLDMEHPAVEVTSPPERNMYVNVISLVISYVLTGVLGLIFWAAAGRLYPPREVGIAAALITSATVLSALAVPLGRLYERFLPLAGTRTGPLLTHGFLVVAATAVLLGIGLVAFGPRHTLFETGWAMGSYPVLVMVLAVFTLQDRATAGLGVARWGAAKNSFHSVAKLAILVIFAGVGSAAAIVASWGTTAAVAALCLLVAVRRRYRSHPRFQVAPNLPPCRELWSYFGSSFGINAAWAIGPLLVPLIVVAELGAEANAHFAVTWAIINALYLMVRLVVCPYVAEVSASPDKVAPLTFRLVGLVAAVSLVSGVGLLVVGPSMLSLVGSEYRADGQGLLYLAAAFVPLSAVGAIYEGLARVQREMMLMMVVSCLSTFVTVFGSLIGTRLLGVVGVGWAYLAAEMVSAIALFVPTALWLRRTVKANGT